MIEGYGILDPGGPKTCGSRTQVFRIRSGLSTDPDPAGYLIAKTGTDPDVATNFTFLFLFFQISIFFFLSH